MRLQLIWFRKNIHVPKVSQVSSWSLVRISMCLQTRWISKTFTERVTSLVWIRILVFKLHDWAKHLPQVSQVCRLSPLWISMCLQGWWSTLVKYLRQVTQVYRLSPVGTSILMFKFDNRVKHIPQVSNMRLISCINKHMTAQVRRFSKTFTIRVAKMQHST